MRDRAAELRDAFDRGFAAAVRGPRAAYVDLLRIRLGGDPYALVLAEISGLHADVRIAPLPASAGELLGIAAIRSELLPVYDLRRVLGVAAPAAPRWFVRVPGRAFAFDGFDGQLRVGALPPASSAAGDYVRGVVSFAGRNHPIIDLAAVAAAVHKENRDV